MDNSPVGLSIEQQQELCDLYRPLSHTAGPPPSINTTDYKRIALDRLLYIYVETLCHDARLEMEPRGRHTATTLRRTRRSSFRSERAVYWKAVCQGAAQNMCCHSVNSGFVTTPCFFSPRSSGQSEMKIELP